MDGGANRGQWSQEVRDSEPTIPILAFEPVSESFNALSTLGLANILCKKLAISDHLGTASINISGSIGMQSSLGLPNLLYQTMYPNLSVLKTELVETVSLDTLPELQNRSIYLKLDVEGHEWQALQGASSLLRDPRSIVAIEIETSVLVTREGERSHYQIISWLETLGFRVFHIFTPGVSRDGRTNYIDCILTRV